MKGFGNFLLFIIFVSLVVAVIKNDQWRTRMFGGTTKIKLEKNEKLINVGWKGTSLWYLTKDMSPSDSAETYIFQEQSNFGVWEGKVVITESK